MPRKRRRKKKNNPLRQAVSAVMDFIEPLSFLIALIVQLIVMGISMSLLGFNVYIKIGFVSIGFVVVMFAVIAYMKGNKVLWFLFAITSIFFSWSFALVGTEAQTAASVESITVQNDVVLKTIRSSLDSARAELDQLNTDYDEAFRGETVDSVLADRKAVRDRISQYESQELERIQLIQSGELTHDAQARASAITADRIFTAMWRAALSGDASRFIQFLIFGFIFVGVELTIITAIKDREKQKAPATDKQNEEKNLTLKKPHEFELSALEEYARVAFGYMINGHFPAQDEMMYRSNQKILTKEVTERITKQAVRRGLIVVENMKHKPSNDFMIASEFVREMNK